MYAIVETGGKQYRVENGSLLQVESLPGDVGGPTKKGNGSIFDLLSGG